MCIFSGIFPPLSAHFVYSAERCECFSEVAAEQEIDLLEWSYEKPTRALQGYCDRTGHVKIAATMEQMEGFLERLERQRWILGHSGGCYAKNDLLVFDFDLLHLCRALDAPSQHTESLDVQVFRTV